MKKNFLNAQNYILWKTEKKKLLSKFFVEKFLKIFYDFLAKLSFYFNEYIWIFILLFIYIIVNIIPFYIINDNDSLQVLFYNWLMLTSFFLLYWLYYFKKICIIKKYNKKQYKILNIKDYFFTKENNIYFPIFFISIYIISFLDFFSENDLLRTWFSFLSILLWFLFYYKLKRFNIAKIKFLSILFLPILLLIFPFIFLYSTIYVFLIKWIKWYKFLKYKPQTKFLEKFEKLEKNFAENKFYKVEIKK